MSTTRAFHWVERAQAKRSFIFNRSHRLSSSGRWRPMRAWRWEARGEHSRTIADDPGRAQLDGPGRATGTPAGECFEEGAGLRRLSVGGDEYGSRCAPPAVSQDAVAAGPPAVCKDFRSVRLRVSAVDRRTSGAGTSHVAVRA